MSSTTGNNPYQAPDADVTPEMRSEAAAFVDGGQAVPVGNASSWIGGGWRLFTAAPGMWIVNIIILFVLMLLMNFIPFLGSIVSNILMPIITGGILLGCRELDNGGSLKVEHLFAGFKDKAGPLALFGLLTLAATIVLVIIVLILAAVLIGGSVFQAMGDDQAMLSLMAGNGFMMIMVIVLLMLALSIPMAMALWFGPSLIVFHNMEPLEAMKQSFSGCVRNMMPFLLYGILFLLLTIAAIVPLMLGLFVLVPMLYGSIYAAYKDIYLQK